MVKAGSFRSRPFPVKGRIQRQQRKPRLSANSFGVLRDFFGFWPTSVGSFHLRAPFPFEGTIDRVVFDVQ
jgi:hypothetical protein